MSAIINNREFDHLSGELKLPRRTTRVYTSPANANVGAQILPPQSVKSTIRLTRYDTIANGPENRDIQLATIGQAVAIAYAGINYLHLPYRLVWFVADVRDIEWRRVPSALTTRNGVQTLYRPASKLVMEWDLYAIPFST